MFNELVRSFQDLAEFFKTSKSNFWAMLLTIGLFAGWNGIQFIIITNHFFYFQDYNGLENFFYSIMQHYSYYMPISIFSLISALFIFWLLHHWAEIELYSDINRPMTFKDKFAGLVNTSMPFLMVMLMVFFLVITLYLLFLIGYLILISFGVSIALSPRFIFFKSLSYMLFIAFFVLFLLNDFVLPQQMRGKGFSESLKNLWHLYQNNKDKFLIYYTIRYFFIIVSLALLWRFLSLISNLLLKTEFTAYYYYRFISVNRLDFLNDYFIVLLKIIVSILLSFFIYALFQFPVYLQQKFFLKRLFPDLFKIEEEESEPMVERADLVDNEEAEENAEPGEQ